VATREKSLFPCRAGLRACSAPARKETNCKEKIMPLPKRIYLENYPYFITTNTFRRIPVFSIPECSDLLVRNIDEYRKRYKFKFLGYSILPCHWHSVIMPKKSRDISDIIRDIKSYTQKLVFEYLRRNKDNLSFKFTCGKDCCCELFNGNRGTEETATARRPWLRGKNRYSRVEQVPVPARREVGYKECNHEDVLDLLKAGKLWQKRFYDHVIRNEQDFHEKLNYINYNAIKHGLVKYPTQWKYSSFHNYELGDHSAIRIDQPSL
jgi:REP element-mobilizing transposase RayT